MNTNKMGTSKDGESEETTMIEIDELKKSGVEYVDEVTTLSVEAQQYLKSFSWCNEIEKGWLAKGWGYILCIFYFKIKPTPGSGADDFIWIIVGDIPPAYIDIQSVDSALEALKAYVNIMEEWINNIKEGKSVDNCFPINVEPSMKHADMLQKRIEIINSDFISELSKEENLRKGNRYEP